VKKRTKQFFLYRHRLGIGYVLLAFIFFALLSFLPTVAPGGISQGEMNSAIASSELDRSFAAKGNIVDLPYHIVQKASLHFFGLNMFSIKLPSIIIAVMAGFFIILLLNRWFKNDVAIIGSILTALSTAFLFLAGNGTPLIMYVFWLALLLWLGSKIVGNDRVHPFLVISFFISLGLSAYTPHMLYVTFAIAFAGIIHPHLRFALKQLTFCQLVLSFGIYILIIAPIIIGSIAKIDNVQALLLMPKFSVGAFVQNISNAFAPFFSFSLVYDSIFLAPLFGLATVTLVIIGILASVGKMYMSRNSVVSLLAIYAIFLSGLNGDVAITVIIPIAILTAAGFESIVDKWYSLFPENPYAHLFGIVPMVVIIAMIVGSGLSHFVYGYHYAPRVANNFNNDLTIITDNVNKETPILITEDTQNGKFYSLLAKYEGYKIISENSSVDEYVTFAAKKDEKFALKQIITSPKSRNSDRLYIYSKVTEQEEKGEK
jgi:hypothetical protein